MSTLPSHFTVSEADGNLYDTRRPDWSNCPPIRTDYAKIKRDCVNDTIAIRAAIRNPYVWPGGYDLYGLTSDGACLCMACAKSQYYSVAWSVRHKVDDGWRIVAIDATCNVDGPLECDHCGKHLVEVDEDE